MQSGSYTKYRNFSSQGEIVWTHEIELNPPSKVVWNRMVLKTPKTAKLAGLRNPEERGK